MVDEIVKPSFFVYVAYFIIFAHFENLIFGML